MGNDGGTILRRKDVIGVRATDVAKANVEAGLLDRVRATQCALSRQPLALPVVSDALGRLYNKDTVVKYLLARSGASKDEQRKPDPVAGHLRGLKDVRELKLAVNPAYKSGEEITHADDGDAPTPFVCPLTQKPMNGRHRFVYIVPSGCVMSESGLRAMMSDGKGEGRSNGGTDARLMPCPVSGTPFDASVLAKREIIPGGDVVIINGTPEEEEAQRAAMERARTLEKQRKKESKAMSASGDKNAEANDAAKGEGTAKQKDANKEEKRKRKEEVMRTLDEERAEQAKRLRRSNHGAVDGSANGPQAPMSNGKEMSAALRSLYGYDKPKEKALTTQHTSNRIA